MIIHTSNAFKTFDEPFKEPDLPDIRIYCAKCGNPQRIAFDDLEDVLSHSDYCDCRFKRLKSQAEARGRQ